MLLKTKPTYYTKYRDQELNNFILDVYDDFRLLEPTLVTELPAPVKEYRGKFVLKQGDPDELYVCVETGSGYAWMKVWYSGEEGSGSGLDADKVDGYDASTTPQANTIPVANGDGSIKDWITDQEILDKLKNVDGSGSGLDADLVRGEEPYHAFVRPPDYDSGWFTAPDKGTALKLTHGLGVKPSFVLFMLRNNDTGSIRIAVGQYIIYSSGEGKYYSCSTTVITDQYISVFAGNRVKLGGLFANLIEGTSGESDTDNVSLRVLCWK